MTLSAETQAVLAGMAEANIPALESLSPHDAQAFFDEALKTPPEARPPVDRVEDKIIPGPDGDLTVRIYSRQSSSPLPALLYFHGGGWVLGTLETHDGHCREVANTTGFAIVAVDYRRAPQHPFPAAPEDCYAALTWVAEHGASVGIDGSRVGVIGDSAGGNLAAAVTLMTRDRGGPEIKVQVLTYPAVDSTMASPSVEENAEGYFLTAASMEYFWGHYLGSQGGSEGDSTGSNNLYASPLQAGDHSNLPPAVVVTAGYDPLRDEGEAYADKLRQAGVEVEQQRYPNVIHGFATMVGVIPEATEALEFEAQFLKRFL